MFVSKKVKEDRLNTCKKCDFYRNFAMLKFPRWSKGARCGKCTCFINAKASLSKEYFGVCPINKWEE